MDSDGAPLDIQPNGKTLSFFEFGSNDRIGLLVSPVLGGVLQDFKVTLAVTLSPHHDETAPSQNRSIQRMYSQRGIRIVVYGFNSEKDGVAEFLSKGSLFLQHPSVSECDARVPYDNPQYWLRPGATMPKLEDLAISTETAGGISASMVLQEAEKDQLLLLFESTVTREDGRASIQPSPRIVSQLKEHQAVALAMMVEKECGIIDGAKFPQLWGKFHDPKDDTTKYRHILTGKIQHDHPTPVRGGILADEMGLGKTLSVLSLICWHLDAISNFTGAADDGLRMTLIISPKSTLQQWQQQIQRHLKPGAVRVSIYHGLKRQEAASRWHDEDVVLTTYDTLRVDWTADGPLYARVWGRVVLDEGKLTVTLSRSRPLAGTGVTFITFGRLQLLSAHNIRNRNSRVFGAACALRSRARWCITGTPIQNSLDDLGALLTFIGVTPFVTRQDFDYWVGRAVRSKSLNAFERVRMLVKAVCLRRTKALNQAVLQLPKKTEKLEVLELDADEKALYMFFKRRASTLARISAQGNGAGMFGVRSGGVGMLSLIGTLRLICDHGKSLLSQSAKAAWESKDNSVVDWRLTNSIAAKCDACGVGIEETARSQLESLEYSCGHIICTGCRFAEGSRSTSSGLEECCRKCAEVPSTSLETLPPSPKAISAVAATEEAHYRPSVKIRTLMRNLHSELGRDASGTEKPSKSVVFSYWTRMLDLIQVSLKADGLPFQRIDGQTSLSKRIDALNSFNNDCDCQVLLASIGSIGEG